MNLKIETQRFNENKAPNIDANYSPDGKWITVTDENWVVFVHDAQSGAVVDDFFGNSVSFNPINSQQFLTVDGTTVSVWTIGQEEPALTISDEENGIRSAIFAGWKTDPFP